MRLIPPHSAQTVSIPYTLMARVPHLLASFTLLTTIPLIVAVATSPEAIAQTVPTLNAPNTQVAQNASASSTASSNQRLLLVNPQSGNDQVADGSEAAPFRTLTQALQVAQPNTIILLASGTYSVETGETFPLVMKPGVTIQGDPTVAGKGYVIQGGGLFISPTSARQNIAMLGADQAVLIGVTLSNPDPRGYGLWVESSNPIVLSNTFTGSGHDGISTVGNSAPLIQGNLFTANGANGITIFGRSHPQVQENIFEQTGYGINIAENAAPLIIGNRISQNRIGIVVQENARPVIRGNLIEGSRDDGLAAIDQAQPDLGSAAEPGNNIFLNNARYDINAAAAKQIIAAAGNQLASNHTSGRIDATGSTAAASTVMVASVADQLPLSEANAALINQLPPAMSSASASPASIALSSGSSATSGLAQTNRSTGSPAIEIPVPPPERSNAVSPRFTAPSTALMQRQVQSQTSTVALSQPTSLPSLYSPRGATNSQTMANGQTVASQQTLTSRQPVTNGQTGSQPRSIDIPVPAPESRVAARPVERPALGVPSSSTSLNPPDPQASTPTLQADLLPVPSEEVPIGNIGDLPTVTVPANSVQRSLSNSVNTTALTGNSSLQYRVLVEANSDRVQDLVRSVIPSAFLIRDRGRSMMQVGAFSSRDNAESAIQLLNQNGLRGLIEKMD